MKIVSSSEIITLGPKEDNTYFRIILGRFENIRQAVIHSRRQ